MNKLDKLSATKIKEPKKEPGIKRKTIGEKSRTNPWMVCTIVLGILCTILLVHNAIEAKKKINNLIPPEILCSKIEVTPSWASWGGEIIAVGFQPMGNQSKLFVDMLIEEKIHFIYHSDCGACEKQIEEFGTEWERYVKSKLIINCGGLG